MSKNGDLQAICRAFTAYDARLAVAKLGSYECVLGELNDLTPICFLSTRKSGQEYRIDYDIALVSLGDAEKTHSRLAEQIDNGSCLFKHNVYPTAFFRHTFTENGLPQRELVDRLGEFLLAHSKSKPDAMDFLESGDTEFLNNCRRLKPKDFKEFVEKVAAIT